MALAVIRACTLDMNADGSMPVMRIKAIWDAAYQAGDTSQGVQFPAVSRRSATCCRTWDCWSGRTRPTCFGKACKWKASEELMEMIEEALGSGYTTTRLAPDHPCLQHDPGSEAGTTRTGRFATEKGLPVALEGGLGREIECGGTGTPFPTGCMRVFDGENMRMEGQNG